MAPAVRSHPARRSPNAAGLRALLCAALCLLPVPGRATDGPDRDAWTAIVRRAQVYTPGTVASKDLATGPREPGAFPLGATVECEYVRREFTGSTPKFACRLANGDEVKVKYGRDNGEVYAEVAASRLLWALGFGADRVYPVRVRCHGCPVEGPDRDRIRERLYAVAAIERPLAGRTVDGPDGEGWAWPELALVDPKAGGAPLAHRDALTLLAALLQHTDSKREQQRLVCLDRGGRDGKRDCRRPFMYIADLGKTFGRATALNSDGTASVNLEAWASTPVWTPDEGCRANLARSLTGTLEHPAISEAGRRFLANRLAQLTSRQLHDLFAAARFPARADMASEEEREADVAAWVAAFKAKVAQVRDRTCPAPPPTR
jgi:hypothetical protein